MGLPDLKEKEEKKECSGGFHFFHCYQELWLVRTCCIKLLKTWHYDFMSWLQACQHFHYNSVLFTELKVAIKMMCAGMKLGTHCSQSGSPFLNLI